MKENRRKCLKCGSVASEDPKVALYRFPKPGVTNIKRCELWAKYCFPDKQWSCPLFQKKLHSDHVMLCSKHFKWTAFADLVTKKLHRHAAPDEEPQKLPTITETLEPAAGPSHQLDFTNVTLSGDTPRQGVPQPTGWSHLADITNVTSPVDIATPAGPQIMDHTYCIPTTSNSTSGRKKVLATITETLEPAAGPSHQVDFTNVTLSGDTPRQAVPQLTGRLHLADITNVTSPVDIAGPAGPRIMDHTYCIPTTSNCTSGRKKVLETTTETSEPAAGPSHQVDFTNVTLSDDTPKQAVPQPTGRSHLADITNVTSPVDITRPAGPHIMDHTYCIPTTSNCTSGRKKVVMDPKTERLYLQCRKYMKKVCNLRKSLVKNRTKEKEILNIIGEDESVKKLSKLLTPTFALLLQGQLRNCKRKSTGRRWNKEEKITALRLYKRSPTCYRLLRRMCYLPSEATLKTLLGNCHMPVGVHKKVLLNLKTYLEKQNPSTNNFILMFDEMSIRKHVAYNKKHVIIDGYQDHGGNHGRSAVEATHALVFMLVGLRKKVKQPIAHYLSGAYVTADRLAVLIKEVLSSCFDSRVNVCATVCDMDGVNRRALTNMGATENNPVIKVENKEIVTLFDTPHLLKCFRNLLMKYDLKCQLDISSIDHSGEGLAKWSHITEFYELDNANPNFVFAPALTKKHLAPNAKEKMKVKLAAQVLSHSVAAGMYAKISNGQLTAEATVTANVVSSMDKLFDSLNSNSPDLHRGKPYATNISDTSPHRQLFIKMRRFFSTMQFVNCRSSPPSKEGWKWTLNGIEKIWSNLRKQHGDIKSLSTRRLQQDPIENLFGCIRSNCGDNCNPTVGQFIGGLKTAILSNMAHMGGSGNCEPDYNIAIINNINTFLSPPPLQETVEKNPLISEMLCAADDELNEESLPEDSGEIQACAYVCGFLIRNNKINCQSCEKILCCEETYTMLHNFAHCKEYNDLKTSLKYASKPFVACVEVCASKTNNFLAQSAHMDNIKKNITTRVAREVNFNFLKGCTEHYEINVKYIIVSVFYICVKRFCVLKNRSYADEKSTTALKRKIDILKHK